jgi:sorting nexin-41/42
MWNDEDNNPYGAFDRVDSHLSNSLHFNAASSREFPHILYANGPLTSFQAPYDHDTTPPSSRSSNQDPPDFVSQLPDSSDDGDEHGGYGGQHYSRKKSVYDSRIEQILYENPELPILITDAGKNHEGGGSFIVYTIRTGVGSMGCFD